MRPDRLSERREAALLRQARRAARTTAQQLAALDERLGTDSGAARERERLSKGAA